MADNDLELLAAYVDGIGELTRDERRAVDRALADPAVRADEAATRELLGELRELPPVGSEPDWTALERSIADATGPDVPRTPWYRRWRFALPALALAATAALIILVLRPDRDDTALAIPLPPAPLPAPAPEPAVFAVYLDGDAIDLELADEDMLGELLDDVTADEALGLASELAPDLGAPEDLAWVDELDADELDQLEDRLEGMLRRGPG